MARICVITDSSAYFPDPAYSGSELVSVFRLKVTFGSKKIIDSQYSDDIKHWFSRHEPGSVKLIPPSIDEFCQLFYELGQNHDSILAIFHSGKLSPTFTNASKAATIVKNAGAVIVIDSHTIGAGLGFLTQVAAEASTKYSDSTKVSQIVRGWIPHIYTALFLPNLRYLSSSGLIDPAQATVGELLGIVPFYILDSGKLIAVQKARNARQLGDLIFEFVTEFSHLSHVSLLQGYPLYEQEIKVIRERIYNSLPDTPISDHCLSLSMLSLLGSNVLGVIAIEKLDGT
jgi:DegV family protein with EDD domain